MSGGGGESALVKIGVAAARPAFSSMRRKVWPDTSRFPSEVSVDDLADAVARSERKLLDQLSAGDGTVIDLKVNITGRQQLTRQDGSASVNLRHLGDFVGAMPEPARPVLLGEPGAGKTVAVIHLLLTLLDQRAQLRESVRARTPVPVRINAAGWDGTDLSAWLTYRLSIDYAQHPRMMRKLVDDGRILPILDGLDEMDHPVELGDERTMPYARAALDAINRSPWRNRPVVVTSRSVDFQRLRDVRGDGGVHGATILTVRALPPEVAVDYLSDYRAQLDAPPTAWDAITDRIIEHPDGTLAIALSTPWLLSLTASALHHSPDIAASLVKIQSPTEIRDHLFATLIPAAVDSIDRTDPTTDHYTTDDVHRWLTTLATHLTRTHAAGFRLNELPAIAGRTWAVITALVAVLAFGLQVWLPIWLTGGGFAFGLTGGLAFGLGAGVTVWLASLSENTTQRLAWRVPGRSRWPRALAVGLLFGLVFGLVLGLVFRLVFGLAAGLAAGLTVGLADAFRTTESDRLRLGQDETRVIRDDLTFGLVFGLTAGLTGGLVFGLVFGLAFGLTSGLAFGLTAGLTGGLLFGLATGLISVSGSVNYVSACLFFWANGVLPRRPKVFLSWARRAGLLRVSGTEYQFRHDTFQQWLAAASAEAEADTRASNVEAG